MARMILKWRYIKSDTPKHNAHLVKYIATREGAEKCDDSWKYQSATLEQQKLAEELVRDFPDTKNSLEYIDYLSLKSKSAASNFINYVIDENIDLVGKRENYIGDIAMRPRVERQGAHGLFSQEDGVINLSEVADEVAVIDLRNPTKSDGNNLLHLVNKYMDLYKESPNNIAYKAKAEKHAKIIGKTLIYGDADATVYGQNSFFYDAAEGLLTSVILLIAEFAPPEQGHIVSVFKLIQDLLSTGGSGGKNQFQTLIELLPPDHKTRWFAGGCAQFQQSGDGEHYVNGDVPVKCVSRYRV